MPNLSDLHDLVVGCLSFSWAFYLPWRRWCGVKMMLFDVIHIVIPFGWVHEIWGKTPLSVKGVPGVCYRVVIPVTFFLMSKNNFTSYVIFNPGLPCVILTVFVLSGACLFRMSVSMVLYSWTRWSNGSSRLTKVSINLARPDLNSSRVINFIFLRILWSLFFFFTFPPSAQHWWKHDLIRWSPS